MEEADQYTQRRTVNVVCPSTVVAGSESSGPAEVRTTGAAVEPRPETPRLAGLAQEAGVVA